MKDRTPVRNRTDLPRQLEMALQTFSPRDVQARVRGGDSAETVAAETGWPLDKVLRYAEPMLAERAFVAEQAQAVEVRRSGGGASLLQTSAAALGVPAENSGIEWDAHRREDGKWIVSATYREADGPHAAQWTYDHAGRNLHPLDEDARTLMGARPVAVPDDELDIADALDLVTEPADASDESSKTRPRLMAVPDSEDAADKVEPEAAPRANHSESTISIPHPSTSDAPDAPAAEPAPAKKTRAKAPAAKTPAAKAPAAKEPAAKTPAAKKTTARKPRARKGRASVPSWDEILFGATKPDDES